MLSSIHKYLFIFLIALLLGGCEQINQLIGKQSSKDDVSAFAQIPPTKIAVLFANAETNPFFIKAFSAFKQVANKEKNITLMTASAGDDFNRQLESLDEFINKGAEAIVINLVDVKKGDLIIEKARPKGIPVVFFNRSPGNKVLFSYDKAVFVDGDAVQGGVLQGLDTLEYWRKNPKTDKNDNDELDFALLKGIPNNASTEARSKWVIGTLSSYPDLAVPSKEIVEDNAFFREDKANEIVTKWIKEGKIKNVEVILANNDTMAIGASKALKAAGLNIPVFGIDAIPQALDMIKTGELAGTVINDADAQAQTCLLAAANLVHGRPATQGMRHLEEYQTILVPYRRIEDKG